MSYHIYTSKLVDKTNQVTMPLQWSAAHEDLTGLIGMVTLNALYCISLQLIELVDQLEVETAMNNNNDNIDINENSSNGHTYGKAGDSEVINKATELLWLKKSTDWDDLNHQIKMYRDTIVALTMDREWAISSNARLVSIFLATLTKVSSISDRIDTNELSVSPLSNTARQLNRYHTAANDVLKNIKEELQITIIANKIDLEYTTYGGTDDIWIIKPVGLSCGEKIVCAKSLLGVLTAVQDLSYKCVVQKYIERPLLVRKTRKFDIRQWVLVTSADPLIIYGFSECYLRLSAESFSLSDESLRCPTVHLCNHAIQKLKVREENIYLGNDVSQEGADISQTADPPCLLFYDTMMSQSHFEEELQRRHSQANTSDAITGTIFETKILPHIKSITVNALESVRDKLQREGHGFEWLGLDLMVLESDHNSGDTDDIRVCEYEVLLLEVNVSPDISLSTPITERLVGPAVKDLFELLLEEEAAYLPLEAATNINALRNEVLAEAGISTSVLPNSEPFALRWNLWHLGSTRGKRSHLAFGRAKEDVAFLGNRVNYSPRKVQYADRVIEILKYSMDIGQGDFAKKVFTEEIKSAVEEDEI